MDKDYIHSEKEIVHNNLTSIANIYKDVFDLVSDHRFVANLGLILRGQQIDEDCISEELFGVKLLSETIKNVRHTKLHKLIKETYNSRIRNSIAHPGRYIDRMNDEVKIYNKGNLVQTMTIKQYLFEVDKLISFHRELTHLKYRAAMQADANFLSTGGIISFETDFFTVSDDFERPHIIINQLSPFRNFSPDIKWWKEAVTLKPIFDSEGNGLSIFVKREPSVLGESPSVSENVYGISPHIKEWIAMVIAQKEIVITHRFCHIPVDISEKEEGFTWIPINIFSFNLNEEHEYFMQYMSESGRIKLNEELISQLQKLIE